MAEKTIVDTETVFFTADCAKDILPYLFQPDIGYTDLKNGKKFDLIDIVIINGDYQYKPWSKEYLEVITVLKDIHSDQNVPQN